MYLTGPIKMVYKIARGINNKKVVNAKSAEHMKFPYFKQKILSVIASYSFGFNSSFIHLVIFEKNT